MKVALDKQTNNHFMFTCQLGAELGARAVSHLEEISDEGIQAMSAASVIAVLLPTTAYILRLKCPPARAMIDSGTILAAELSLHCSLLLDMST